MLQPNPEFSPSSDNGWNPGSFVRILIFCVFSLAISSAPLKAGEAIAFVYDDFDELFALESFARDQEISRLKIPFSELSAFPEKAKLIVVSSALKDPIKSLPFLLKLNTYLERGGRAMLLRQSLEAIQHRDTYRKAFPHLSFHAQASHSNKWKLPDPDHAWLKALIPHMPKEENDEEDMESLEQVAPGIDPELFQHVFPWLKGLKALSVKVKHVVIQSDKGRGILAGWTPTGKGKILVLSMNLAEVQEKNAKTQHLLPQSMLMSCGPFKKLDRHDKEKRWRSALGWLKDNPATELSGPMADLAPKSDDLYQRQPHQAPRFALSNIQTYFVDQAKGSNTNAGSHDQPWQRISHALAKLKAGDSLYIREGLYDESLDLNLQGEAQKPILISGYPGERVVIDAGYAEFTSDPQGSWEPFTHENVAFFRSTRPYEIAFPHAFGHMLGSKVVPLHCYRNLRDFLTNNIVWDPEKSKAEQKVTCGPGLYYDESSKRIWVRFPHTNFRSKYVVNYQGEQDPRKMKMSISGGDSRIPLMIRASRHLVVKNLVLRGGAGKGTVMIDGSQNIRLSHLTVHGARGALRINDSHKIKVLHSAIRGYAAPWTFRTSQKYQSFDQGLVYCGGKNNRNNSDLEFAWCEFSDDHDGIFLGNSRYVKFHHNVVHNFNDDGLFLTANSGKDGKAWGGGIFIYQNHFSRILSSLAFGTKRGLQYETGMGLFIYRNVFDLRVPVIGAQPFYPGAHVNHRETRLWGEHGDPVWEPIFFYHNTVIRKEKSYRSFYAAGLGSHTAPFVPRWIFNNIFTQQEGPVGLRFQFAHPLQCDNNLHWSFQNQSESKSTLKEHLKLIEGKSMKGKHDLIQDPKFKTESFTLSSKSPAIDRGREDLSDLPDPLKKLDPGKPDCGALPSGTKPTRIGVMGRYVISQI